MNRTVLAVIVLVVVVALAGYLFYDGSANEGDTVIDKADQSTPPGAPAGAPVPAPAPAP